MTAPVTIRPLQEGDFAAFRVLRLEALRLHPSAFGGDYVEEAAESTEYWRNLHNNLMNGQTQVGLVAEVAGAGDTSDLGSNLAGIVTIRRGHGTKMNHAANVYSMYVREAWRGHGVADALLRGCAVWATKRGVRLLKLSVETTNPAAIRCYTRNGFSVYGVDPAVICIDEHFYDVLLMVRWL